MELSLCLRPNTRPPPQTLTPQSPPLPQDEDAFPVLKGKHEKFVQHPSVKFPNWSSFSLELKNKIYASYESYVANWYKGKKGKPYTSLPDISDEEWEKFTAELSAWSADDEIDEASFFKLPKLTSGG